MKNSLGLLFVILIALSGCVNIDSYNKTISDYASRYPSEVSLSKKYLLELKERSFTGIEENIDPHIKNKELPTALEKMADLFPAGNPTEIKLVGLIRNEFSGAESVSTTTISYEYNFSGKWLLATVVLQSKANDIYIAGLHVTPLQGSLEATNKFTLRGKRVIDYIILIVTCIVPLLIVYALFVCAVTPMPKRKWLWIVFILFGFGSVTLNWTDGTIHGNLLYFSLLGAGFSSPSPYDPVTLLVSLPLGAIVFLLRRKKSTPSKVGPLPDRNAGAATIYSGAPRKTFGRRGTA